MAPNFIKDTVWLIDDDVVDQAINRDLLSQVFPKIKIQSFTNPVEALRDLRALGVGDKAPVLLFLDRFMPQLNATEFLEIFFREIHPKLPRLKIVIMQPAANAVNPDLKHPCIYGLIQKPFLVPDLEQIKNQVLLQRDLSRK